MALSTLASDYNDLREKLALTIPVREKLFGDDHTFELKNYKALSDENRTVLFALIKIVRDDRQFRRLLGDSMFSHDEISKILAADHPHVKMLRSCEAMFTEIVRAVNPRLKQLRRLVYNQTRLKDVAHITKSEKDIRALTAEITKILAPYQTLGTMVHQESPGTEVDQDVNNPTRFVKDPQSSLWILVKMVSEMSIYLAAVASIAKDRPLPTPKKEAEPVVDDNFVGYDDKNYYLPNAIEHCKAAGGVLASAGEMAIFKQQTKNRYYFHSRTVCIYYKDNNKDMIAFYDDTDHNVLLTRAQEGYNAHREGKWIRPLDDKDVAHMIANGRRIRLPRNEDIAVDSISTNPVIITMLGQEGAKAWQEHMKNIKREYTSVYFLDKTPKQGAEIRLLGVGNYVNNLDASVVECGNDRRCVGVRKISTGN